LKNKTLSYKDYLFVGIQIVIFIAYALPVRFVTTTIPGWLRYLGLVILGLGVILGLVALLQINTNLSPFPTPVEKGKLIMNGAFAISRHPIYTALMFSGLGYALYRESLYKFFVTTLVFILFNFKSRYEEQLLAQKFAAYKKYQQKTRRFL